MKKLFGLILSIMLISTLFVGCSKESNDKYYLDVYDYWNANVVLEGEDIIENSEYYSPNGIISYQSNNINKLLNNQFSDLKNIYLKALNQVNSNILELSYLFIHDPNLKDKALKNAQKTVTEYKDELNNYDKAIKKFKESKSSFENACLQMQENEDQIVVGIIEQGAYNTFIKAYVELINANMNCYDKMYNCAKSMYLFDMNKIQEIGADKINLAVMTYAFDTKKTLLHDYIDYSFNILDNREDKSDKEIFKTKSKFVNNVEINESTISKQIVGEQVLSIKSKLQNIDRLLICYKSETKVVKQAMKFGNFDYNIENLDPQNKDDASGIIANHFYENLKANTLENLVNTFNELVAFYK